MHHHTWLISVLGTEPQVEHTLGKLSSNGAVSPSPGGGVFTAFIFYMYECLSSSMSAHRIYICSGACGVWEKMLNSPELELKMAVRPPVGAGN